MAPADVLFTRYGIGEPSRVFGRIQQVFRVVRRLIAVTRLCCYVDVVMEPVVDRRAIQNFGDLIRRNPAALLIHVTIVRLVVFVVHTPSGSIEPLRNVVEVRREEAGVVVEGRSSGFVAEQTRNCDYRGASLDRERCRGVAKVVWRDVELRRVHSIIKDVRRKFRFRTGVPLAEGNTSSPGRPSTPKPASMSETVGGIGTVRA